MNSTEQDAATLDHTGADPMDIDQQVPPTGSPATQAASSSSSSSDAVAQDASAAGTTNAAELSSKPRRKLTKRDMRLQEKLKKCTTHSLFDSDGDVSHHNIIKAEDGQGRPQRASRKRKMDDITPPAAPKTPKSKQQQQKQQQAAPAVPPPRVKKLVMPPSTASLIQQREKSVQQLRPTPKTPLDAVRNQFIADREEQIQKIQNHRDTLVHQLAHLEVYQSLVDYRPDVYNTDERVIKYINEHNIWDMANAYLIDKHRSQDERSSKGRRAEQAQQPQQQKQAPLPLIRMLQHSSELDLLRATQAAAASSSAFGDLDDAAGSSAAAVPNKMLLHRLPPVATMAVNSGTGLRRFHRQFPTLRAYLDTFTALDDDDDASVVHIREHISSERAIRERIEHFENLGRFASGLKGIADGRAHTDPVRRSSDERVHDSLVAQFLVASKNFGKHGKYRRNAARRCAKAIEKYWEAIRTREDRLQRSEIKRMTRLAKWTAQQVQHKWRVVERICEARYKEVVKEQQAKKSRRHLELILEHSEQVLGARKSELAMSAAMEIDTSSAASTPAANPISNPMIHDWYAADSTTTDQESDLDATQDDAQFTTDDDGDNEQDHIIDDDAAVSDEAGDDDNALSVEQLMRKYGYSEPSIGGDDDASMADLFSDQTDDDAAQGEYVSEEGSDEHDHVIDDAAESDEAADDDNALTVEQLMQKYGYGDATTSKDDSASLADLLSNQESDENNQLDDPSDYDAASSAAEDDVAISDAEETDDDQDSLQAMADLPLDVLFARYPGMTASSEAKPAKSIVAEEDEEEEEKEEEDSLPNAKRRKMARLISPIRTPSDIYTGSLASKERHDEDDDRTVTDDEEEEPLASEKQQEIEPTPQESDVESRVVSAAASPSPVAGAGMSRSSSRAPSETQLPTGTTLSTTKVITKVPFLLRGTLREYQHVGLDWLVSLHNHGLNGILADEMGLGKTIQTIALLASLACEKGIWGPHLVVVPTSVILNWEMEFKRWLPGFKILTYYGNQKERKEKRMGWSRDNAFHVCITSYQLVLQDQTVFRRKHWQYLILDEAHNIKNFRSQRWQVLLNFNAQHRLLLTGTPLQNSLVELWSLLYFLMPHGVSSSMPVGFANLSEFQEWFANPVDLMFEQDNVHHEESRQAIQKLHTVLRPYLLRRLKADVEQQMPAKYEHVVYCRLSKRQRYLYDDFMGRTRTKENLASGNFLSIMNTLMQLRKVCNHPDLFEERPIVTSFSMKPEILESASHLDQWTRSHFSYDDRVDDLDASNLLLVRPWMENAWTRSLALDTAQLDASSLMMAAAMEGAETSSSSSSRGPMALHARATRRKYLDIKTFGKFAAFQQQQQQRERWALVARINQRRCTRQPLYGIDLLTTCQDLYATPHNIQFFPSIHDAKTHLMRPDMLRQCILSNTDRVTRDLDLIERYTFVTPAATVRSLDPVAAPPCHPAGDDIKDIFHPIDTRLRIAFPDKRLLQYDCGKLQRLAVLLHDLAANGHRMLIFTQMTRVLDILEAFLNMHGYRYLRLDGATKVERRQFLTERFNSDPRITCFILSTRSGGLGINLTGADTVIFYDSDWNPSMDKQCQDRAHRIGQLRDVHIYRFVTQFTIEENIFRKANQKLMLDNMVIQEGDFTNDYLQKTDWWRDLPEVLGADQPAQPPSGTKEPGMNHRDFEQALLAAEEDETDAQAAIEARKELTLDDHEFNEATSNVSSRHATPAATPTTPSATTSKRAAVVSPSPSPSSPGSSAAASPAVHPSLASTTTTNKISSQNIAMHQDTDQQEPLERDVVDQLPLSQADTADAMDLDVEVGHVDQYMLRFWEREVFGHYLGFGGLPEPDNDDQE
ncbi:SNF2 family N-terminal domain-containing protein [Gongronella butleri]|nr:SNF2 family N-terminal domain-containing protein [Gongronella butleri]